ncbi:P-loop containing nucleoside triphosphate hydrolase protein [Hypoxylon sp. FL0543]|nr:P-loop containing nucleoside triphosphate hydrolase protein [Hypoxylon sp. FL0543]
MFKASDKTANSYFSATIFPKILDIFPFSLVPIRGASRRCSLRPLIIFILGAPGVGKGTLSGFLKASFPGLTHLSYGDLVRYHDQIPGSWVSSLPRRQGTSSPLLPVHGAVRLLRETIETGAVQHGQMTWLVDGFPRREDHVAEWLKQMPQADRALYLFCPPEVSSNRIIRRARTSGRPDDVDPEKVWERVQRFHIECEPMLNALKNSGIEVVKIDAHRDLDAVKKEIFGCVQASLGCGMNREGDE